jgi:hypothetical protein
MSNLDGDASFSSFAPEPQMDLKRKGMPWPVYLAGGLAVAAVAGFFGYQNYREEQRRKTHIQFMNNFQEFEQKETAAFWTCLFGKDAQARLNAPEQVTNQLEVALRTDVKGFPEKVQSDCIPRALSISKKLRNPDPVPPQEYDAVLRKYSETMAGFANALNLWAEGAPKRMEAYQTIQKIKSAGDTWSGTGNPRKPDPEALKYDRFLTCALPDLPKMKDAQEALEFLAKKCFLKGGDREYLTNLRDKCLVEGQTAPAKPPASFAANLAKLAGEYSRESDAWDSCFKNMSKLSRRDDVEGVARSWVEVTNALTAVKKTAADIITPKEEKPEEKGAAPGPGKDAKAPAAKPAH